MINIEKYLDDGANWQAQAVLAYLRYYADDITYREKNHEHVEIKVGRFENCREQGYIFSIYYNWKVLMNYAVYQHRCGDSLCIHMFKTECNINTPDLDAVYKDGCNVDKEFKFGQIAECGEWLMEDMRDIISEAIYQEKNKK